MKLGLVNSAGTVDEDLRAQEKELKTREFLGESSQLNWRENH
jgi:hypothetical protein